VNDLGHNGGGELTDVASIDLTVRGENDTPEAIDGSAVIDEDTSYTFSASDFGLKAADTERIGLRSIFALNLQNVVKNGIFGLLE